MNLKELFEAVLTGEAEARVRNTKTAVNVLAKVLGYDRPETCPREAYTLPLSRLYALIDQHLQGKGPHIIRNTKNYLSKLFRAAADKGVLPLVSSSLTRQYTAADWKNKPHRPGSSATRNDGSYFRFTHWPAALKKEWDDLYQWCTAPLIGGRPAKQRKRPSSMESYLHHFEGFFGYVLREKHFEPHTLCFEQLWTFPLVRDYVHWHVNVKHQRATLTLHKFFACLKTLSHTYKPDKEFHDALSQLHLTLPPPDRVYNKEDAWLSLERLSQVATALWPKKQPGDFKSSGARSATHAGLSLTLHLLCAIPYRQRNIREMELDKNLYRNSQGEWRLRFAGKQLKIARKDGKENVFDLCFPKHLVPLLEQYLSAWRPILLAKRGTPSPLVFLNSQGKAYATTEFTRHVQANVYRFTGKAFYPHLIRTIWATTYIRQTGDLYTAAIMLNDKLETVVKTYAHLNEQGAAEKAYLALQSNYNLTPLPALPPPAVLPRRPKTPHKATAEQTHPHPPHLSRVGILRGKRHLDRYSQNVILDSSWPRLRNKAAKREQVVIEQRHQNGDPALAKDTDQA